MSEGIDSGSLRASWLRIPIRGYEAPPDRTEPPARTVTNPYKGL